MGGQTNGLSNQWAVGLMGCQPNGLSDQWACRTDGLSDHRKDTITAVMVCHGMLRGKRSGCISYISIIAKNRSKRELLDKL